MRISLNFVLGAFILFSQFFYAQDNQLTENSEISLITIGPGSNLHDSFGHSAIHVLDKTKGIDWVFNYGIFDFRKKGFYLKFAQGKLNYSVGLAKFRKFTNYYHRHNRWMKQQVLNLTLEERQRYYNFLIDNVQPENAEYLYDPFHNNCATKLPYVTEQVLGKESMLYQAPSTYKKKSFRALMHDYLPRNTWGCFGIDIALGAVMDNEASLEEHMYLPDYVFDVFANSKRKNGQPLVKATQEILKSSRTKKTSFFWTSPLLIFGILALFILWITYKDKQKNRVSRWLDLTLFSITGLVGLLVFLLWFATDHKITTYNYNLLWAFPLNLILVIAFIRKTTKKWVLNYLKLLLLMLCLLCLHWIIGIQIFALGLLPFLIAIGIRYLYLITYYKQQFS